MIVQSHEAHAAIVSDDFLSAGALAIGFITVLHALMWLGFTFLLLLIFKSLKYNDIFEKKNITRLRLIALIVGISPLFQLMKNLLFAQVLQKQVSLQKHYISFYYDYSLFSGCLYMILIMVLVEVFRYGMSIKRENDLTV